MCRTAEPCVQHTRSRHAFTHAFVHPFCAVPGDGQAGEVLVLVENAFRGEDGCGARSEERDSLRWRESHEGRDRAGGGGRWGVCLCRVLAGAPRRVLGESHRRAFQAEVMFGNGQETGPGGLCLASRRVIIRCFHLWVLLRLAKKKKMKQKGTQAWKETWNFTFVST